MKTYKLLLAVLTFVAVVACGGQKPSEVAIESIKLMDKGKITEYVELISGTKEPVKKQIMIVLTRDRFEELSRVKRTKLGNLRDIKLISEEIAEDGKTCKVKLELTYDKSPKPSKKTVDLVLEDGKWLVKNPTQR